LFLSLFPSFIVVCKYIHFFIFSNRKKIRELAEQLRNADEVFEREAGQKNSLLASVETLQKIKDDKEALLTTKQEHLSAAENEPNRLSKWAETVEKAAVSMDNELRIIHRKIKSFDAELDKQAKRRVEAEKLRKSLLEKLELNRQTIEQREKDVSAVRASLDNTKAVHRDLLTAKVALQSQKKDIDG
jgi:translation initiation factor 2B subunit (eIF-2B alpha/beta/delta family)